MLKPGNRGWISFASLLAIVLFLAACGQNQQADSNSGSSGLLAHLAASTKTITIPAGTPITVTLDQSLSSNGSSSGERFDASVASPVVVDGKTVIPKDARAEGRVVEAIPSGHLHSVAHLELALEWVEVGGKQYEISTNENGRTGKNHNKRNLALIGGGTGVGALIGALAGGGKGALIGGAVGAGAGTGAAYATGKKDIRLPAETELTFRLANPVSIPVKE